MASVYKKTRRVVDPQTGKRIKKKSRKWWVKYRDEDGVIQRKPAFTDKTASQQYAAQLEKEAELAQAGGGDPYKKHRARPLAEHLDGYREFLAAKETSEKHVQQVFMRADTVVKGCGFVFFGDISPSAVQSFLAELKRSGRSAQTVNFYLSAIRQFLNWMVRDRRVPDNPLKSLRGYNVRADRRHDRRALSPDEFTRLIGAAENGSVIEGVPGRDRAMLYLVATWTGLRRKELSSLTRRSLNLDQQSPTVTVEAAYTKNGRQDVIPLHPVIADRLRTWLDSKESRNPDTPLFPLITPKGHFRKTAKMMKRDLGVARDKWIGEAKTEEERQRRKDSDFLKYQNEDKLFADFHSNRHAFITNLAQAGVHPKMAQSLARHSTIDLTMNTYTHVAMAERAAAVSSLPAPILPKQCDEQSNRDGTSEIGAQIGAQQLPLNGQALAPSGNERGETPPMKGVRKKSPNSCGGKGFGSEKQPLAGIGERKKKYTPEDSNL